MRIVVCVKHVPDMQSERRFEGGRLVRGEDDVLNELDENAIEAAVQLKESEEDAGREAEVVALTMGPEDAEDSLMRALQMGADRAYIVSDEFLEGSDVITTASVLSVAIAKIAQETSSRFPVARRLLCAARSPPSPTARRRPATAPARSFRTPARAGALWPTTSFRW